MKIDENWFKLYEPLYGKTFNRLLTIGNGENNYINYNINTLEELKNQLNDFSNNEFFLSVYNYKTSDNILRWSTDNLDKYEKHAEKNCIILRFRQNIDVIREEVNSLSDIQKFMFIRRSLNLGYVNEMINETIQVYNFFKTHFDIRGILIYNGYNECILYYPKEELSLHNPSLTYYKLLKLLEEKLNLNTLIYENIEPYAQLMPLPGTQNKNSRLYVQLYHPYNTYEEIIKNSQNKFLDTEQLKFIEVSKKFHDFLKKIDKEISKNKNKHNLTKIWDKI